jgi:hypothetical protein
MELADLDKEERVALAGLLEYVVLASGHVTEDEQREIDAIIDAIGAEAYQAAMDEVDARFADEKALRDFLLTIAREEAREVIFGVITEAAMADTVEGRESALLDWLTTAWNLEVHYEEPPDEATKAQE